jgi:hypothetical protein
MRIRIWILDRLSNHKKLKFYITNIFLSWLMIKKHTYEGTKAFWKAGNHRFFVNIGSGSAFIIHKHQGQPNECGSTRIRIHNTAYLDSNFDDQTTNAEQLRHTVLLPYNVTKGMMNENPLYSVSANPIICYFGSVGPLVVRK